MQCISMPVTGTGCVNVTKYLDMWQQSAVFYLPACQLRNKQRYHLFTGMPYTESGWHAKLRLQEQHDRLSGGLKMSTSTVYKNISPLYLLNITFENHVMSFAFSIILTSWMCWLVSTAEALQWGSLGEGLLVSAHTSIHHHQIEIMKQHQNLLWRVATLIRRCLVL